MSQDHGRQAPALVPPESGSLARELFAELPRADQRRWAGAYLEGLLHTPGKKSVRNMARAGGGSDTAWQSLHQIVNASTWRWGPVRTRLAQWCAGQEPVHALILASVTVPKRGRHSVGVHRRFDPSGGRTLGCQYALGLFLAGPHGAVPVDWRLHLPGPWTEDERLRRRAAVPDSCRPQDPQDLAPGLLASGAASTAAHVPVLARAATGREAPGLLGRLAGCGRPFTVAVPASTPIAVGLLRPMPGRHTPDLQRAATAGELLRRLGRASTTALGPGDTLRIAPAVVRVPGCPRPLRVAAEWPADGGPRQILLSGAHGGDLEDAVRPAVLHDLAAPAARLPQECGLHDFEGRSFPGWHRHMTLVSAACAQRTLGAVPGAVRETAA